MPENFLRVVLHLQMLLKQHRTEMLYKHVEQQSQETTEMLWLEETRTFHTNASIINFIFLQYIV